MANSFITKKVWNIASILKDAGVSYTDYLEQITFLLFLKMVDENKNTDEEWRLFNDIPLPEGISWGELNSKSGQELKDYYESLLSTFAKQKGMIGEIYRNAQNKIQTPVHLKKVISMINGIEWNALSEDVKGDIYEGLLEKIAQDTKSGAGQYFTPRALINVIVRCVNPTLGKKITDPCCGSGGFLLSTKKFLMDKYKIQEGDQMKKLKNGTFYGNEIVPNTYRLCLMNLLLHGIGEFGGKSPISWKDSLANQPSDSELSDFVLTNPPFGKKSSTTVEKEVVDKETGEITTKITKERETYSRPDFIVTTTNKQLNFVQHIKSLLKVGGTAAVVLPDNVLFEGGAGETIRRNLLDNCDLHTILRLPTGLFYAQGIKANVLFFEKKPASEQIQTKEVWIYDYRTNIKHTLKLRPLKESNLKEFIECYQPENRFQRKETYNAVTNPEGRWRKFTYEEIIARDLTNLDITWIKQKDDIESIPLNQLFISLDQKSRKISEAIQNLNNHFSFIEKNDIYGSDKKNDDIDISFIKLVEGAEYKILDLAVHGHLVPQDPNDEPSSILLERIREEKEKLIKEKKLKKKDIEEIPISDDEIPFNIPDSWEWIRIGSIFNHSSGKQLRGSDTEGTLHEYITTSNLYWGKFELVELKSMYYKDSEIEKCTAKKGDLLVCEGGDVGRSAIWSYDYDICLQNHVHRLRPYENSYTSFVFYIMWYYKKIGLVGGKGIGIQGLSASVLKSIIIPFPPLAEQQRIVAKIEEVFKEIDKLKV